MAAVAAPAPEVLPVFPNVDAGSLSGPLAGKVENALLANNKSEMPQINKARFNYMTTNSQYGVFNDQQRRNQISLLETTPQVQDRMIGKDFRDNPLTSRNYGKFYYGNEAKFRPRYADNEDYWSRKYKEYFQKLDRGPLSMTERSAPEPRSEASNSFLPPINSRLAAAQPTPPVSTVNNDERKPEQGEPPQFVRDFMHETLKLPDIRAVNIQLTMGNNSVLTFRTKPDPKQPYEWGWSRATAA